MVPSGVVSENLKKALARTAKLQTRSEVQGCIRGKRKEVVNITARLKPEGVGGLKERKEDDVHLLQSQ
jgi:hypothetical protein